MLFFFQKKKIKWQIVLYIAYVLKRNVLFLLSYPVKRMVETGKEILQKNNVTDLSDAR